MTTCYKTYPSSYILTGNGHLFGVLHEVIQHQTCVIWSYVLQTSGCNIFALYCSAESMYVSRMLMLAESWARVFRPLLRSLSRISSQLLYRRLLVDWQNQKMTDRNPLCLNWQSPDSKVCNIAILFASEASKNPYHVSSNRCLHEVKN